MEFNQTKIDRLHCLTSKLSNQNWLLLDIISHISEDGEKCVSDLIQKFNKEQSVISGILRQAKPFFEIREESTFRFYDLSHFWYTFSMALYDFNQTKVSDLQFVSKDDIKRFKSALRAIKSTTKNVRIKIFNYILENPSTKVEDIYRNLNLEQSIVSDHIGILQDAGFVTEEKSGRFRLKSVDIDFCHKFIEILNQISL